MGNSMNVWSHESVTLLQAVERKISFPAGKAAIYLCRSKPLIGRAMLAVFLKITFHLLSNAYWAVSTLSVIEYKLIHPKNKGVKPDCHKVSMDEVLSFKSTD